MRVRQVAGSINCTSKNSSEMLWTFRPEFANIAGMAAVRDGRFDQALIKLEAAHRASPRQVALLALLAERRATEARGAITDEAIDAILGAWIEPTG